MNPNVKPSDQVTLLGVHDPVSESAGTVTLGWFAAADFFGFLAKVCVGVMASGSTVAVKLRQATSAAGAGAKDITGKAATTLTEAGTDDEKQVLINLRPEELDVNNDFTHFELSITVASAASLIYAEVQGINARNQPAEHVDTVDEVVD